MRRLFALALAAALLAPWPAAAVRAQDQPGSPAPPEPEPVLARIVHLTDTHVGSAGWNRYAQALAAAIRGMDPRPALIIHGGDLTETGAPAQYELYDRWLREVGIPAHHIPGNHDARWLDAGKATFRRLYGPPSRSLDVAGVHIILLDVTVDGGNHGHLHPETAAWLKADLEKVGKDRPVLVFLHHFATYPPLSVMDNEEDLARDLAGYNIRGVFTGHGHLHLRWEWNGVPYFMTKAGYEGGMKVLDITATRLLVYDWTYGEPGLRLAAEIPLRRPAAPGEVRIQGFDPATGRLTVTTRDLPSGARVWYKLAFTGWQPMQPGAAGTWTARVDTAGLPPGRDRLEVVATAEPTLPGQPAAAEPWQRQDLGRWWSDHFDFDVPARRPADPRVLWQYRAGGSLQAAPAVDTSGLYVAATDGTVTALGHDGKVRWQFQAGGTVAGSPALAGERLIVADAAGTVTALDRKSGQVLWQVRVAGAVVAEPLVTGGRVVVGDTAGWLYALDTATGAEVWRYRVGAAVRARATAGAGRVYVGAWDQSVHAVDAATGAALWRTPLPGTVYYSPATAPFLYFRGRLFVTRTPPGGEAGLYALDAATGRVLWQQPGSFGFSTPILHGGLVAVAGAGGTVEAFDPLTGQRRWQAETGITIFDGALSAYGDTVVAAGLHGRVVAVDPAGARRWTYALGDTYAFARPAAGGDRLYVAAMDGRLVALAAPAGPAPALTYNSPGLAPAPPPPTFPDLAGHWAAPAVAAAQAMGLAAGFPDGTYGPARAVTRAELAALLARYLELPAPAAGAEPPFRDITGHWAEGAIRSLHAAGLVGGVPGPDGTRQFEPDRPVTRAEAAALLARVLGRAAPSAAFASRLGDMDGHWAAQPVRALEEIGLVAGIPGPDGALRYRPDQPVTRAEAAVLLVRLATGQ